VALERALNSHDLSTFFCVVNPTNARGPWAPPSWFYSHSVRRVLSVSYSAGHYWFRISTESSFDPQVAQHMVQIRRFAFPIFYKSPKLLCDAISLNIAAGG
jgi:hypothetical protein